MNVRGLILRYGFNVGCFLWGAAEALTFFIVPDVLLSGNHEQIRRWRLKQALGRTWLRRPDLLECRCLSSEEAQLLEEFKQERH